VSGSCAQGGSCLLLPPWRLHRLRIPCQGPSQSHPAVGTQCTQTV
jgi:hypothetical protein